MRRWVWALLLAAVMAGCTLAGGKGPAMPGAVEQVTAAESVGPEPSAAPPGQIPPDWLPALDEVVTLHLHLGVPVPLEQAPQPIYASHPVHRATIAHLLDVLTVARLAGGELSLPARAPSLQVALKGGAAVSVRLAYNCTPFSSEEGHGYTCRQAPGELILHTRQGREVRVFNEPLAQWLLGGWKAHIPVGVMPDLEKEMALALARQVDAKAPWKATFYAEYPLEGKGGTEVRRAWVVVAEYPAGHKTRLVIDAQTGAVVRHLQIEALP